MQATGALGGALGGQSGQAGQGEVRATGTARRGQGGVRATGAAPWAARAASAARVARARCRRRARRGAARADRARRRRARPGRTGRATGAERRGAARRGAGAGASTPGEVGKICGYGTFQPPMPGFLVKTLYSTGDEYRWVYQHLNSLPGATQGARAHPGGWAQAARSQAGGLDSSGARQGLPLKGVPSAASAASAATWDLAWAQAARRACAARCYPMHVRAPPRRTELCVQPGAALGPSDQGHVCDQECVCDQGRACDQERARDQERTCAAQWSRGVNGLSASGRAQDWP